jgi:glutathione S-transferase
MKIYDSSMAPNPRRVRIFLAEKGIQVPYEQVNIATAENRQPEFLARNPLGGVPVLELDDGTYIAESVAICRYFEELHPEPPLFGTDALDKSVVEMWQRRMELNLFNSVALCFRNTHEFFKGRIPQVPEYGKVSKEGAEKTLEWLNGVLADRPFIAGPHYTIADITALVGIDFGRVSAIRITEDQTNLKRWYDSVASRPSAKA